MLVAQVTPGRERGLRDLLNTMNSKPGMADPANAVLPFGQFERLHFALLAVLDDPTLGDIEAHGVPRPSLPIYLAFAGSCDGPAGECIADLAQRAATGLRRIFMHCDGFDAQSDLLVWMRMPGDIIFSVGAVTFTWFVLRLWVGPTRPSEIPAATEPATR